MRGGTPHTWMASTPDGYVVGWDDGNETLPLACFGDWQSAAIQYRRMLDRLQSETTFEKFQSYIRLKSSLYLPSEIYGYPVKIANGFIYLVKQKKTKDIKQ